MNKELQSKSLFAPAHAAFWEAKADQYLQGIEESRSRLLEAFIGYVIKDWVQDVNASLNAQASDVVVQQILCCWDSFEDYDQWLLRSMLHPQAIIRQIQQMYFRNESEIKRLLGDDNCSYVNDFSADFYYCNGIDVPRA